MEGNDISHKMRKSPKKTCLTWWSICDVALRMMIAFVMKKIKQWKKQDPYFSKSRLFFKTWIAIYRNQSDIISTYFFHMSYLQFCIIKPWINMHKLIFINMPVLFLFIRIHLYCCVITFSFFHFFFIIQQFLYYNILP